MKPYYEVQIPIELIPTSPAGRILSYTSKRTFYRRDKAVEYARAIGATHVWAMHMDHMGCRVSESFDV